MNKKLILLSIIVAHLCFACGDENISSLKMGEDYVNSESGIILIDTLSIKLSTLIIDSIQTSNSGAALVGSYNTPEMGNVSSDAVFRVTLPTEAISDEDVLDSITLCLFHNQYYEGDTSSNFSFKIYEMETDIEDISQSIFYNTSTVAVKDEPIGEASYLPSPNNGDELEFKLNDEFSNTLFNLFLEDADEVGSESSFLDYFKGIVLRGEDNNAVIGYSTAAEQVNLKMYYHRVNEEKVEFTALFPIEVSNYQFNSISSNRETSLLAELQNQEDDIASTSTEDQAFIQGSSGLMTKIMFPGLANIFQLVLLDQIIKAELILTPTTKTITNNDYDLPESLYVFTSDSKNNRDDILTSDGSTPLVLSLVRNPHDYEESYYYSIDITQYIIAELLEGYFDPDFALIAGLTTTDQTTTLQSLIIGGENNADFIPKLKLYTYYY